MSTASLVMGILSIVCCCCGWVGIVFSVLGIIFAMVSREEGSMNNQSKAGLILSIIGIVLAVLVIVLFVGLEFMAVGSPWYE